jgi:DNA gyrase/topoisomerase IV subunit A
VLFFLLNGVCDKKTNRNQITEIRKQKTGIRKQISENRRQKTENRKQISETRNQITENRRQKTEDRCQKSENGKPKTENGNQISRLWAGICLRVSDPRLPAVFLFPQEEVFRNMLGNDPLCVFCPCIER